MNNADLDALTKALRRGHREPQDARLGLEVENFVLRAKDGAIVPYTGARGVGAMLARSGERLGAETICEGEHLLGLRLPGGGTITLEPGAQMEWSSPLCEGLPGLAQKYGLWRDEQRLLEEEFGVRFHAVGAHPTASPDQIERLPKARYAVMEPWLGARGKYATWMMKGTCGVQVNLDHRDEDDAMRKLRVALRLAPVFNAIFANSAVAAGKQTGFASWRGNVWTSVDPQRCGIPEALAKDGSSFRDYVEWALAAPMLFVQLPDGLHDIHGTRWEDWDCSCELCPGDWDLHLSTFFPEARFRPQLELRHADAVPPELGLGYAVLARAIFDRPAALAAAERLGARWSHPQRLQAWDSAHRDALSGADPLRGRLLDRARELLAFAEPLTEEQPYLEPVRELLADGRSLGERARVEASTSATAS
ncbi:MAG: glutamate-cysteine ligase family protein [Planctomycetota bacterium]|nr:glutamate-cysteine ligase family protein [Planctomycetota bacterium]